MFVAQRELKIADPQGNVRVFKPGDEIPGFADWDIHARRANLNLEWVTEVADGERAPAPTPPPSAPIEEPAPPLAASAVVHSCLTCSKRFKSASAVKAHATIVHK